MRIGISVLLAVLASAQALPALTWAQLALGGGYEAILIVNNKTGFEWVGEIWVKRGDEERWEGSWAINGQDFTGLDGARLTLGPRESAKLTFTGDQTTRSGYLELFGEGSSSSLDVAVAYFYNFYQNGALQDSTGSPPSKADDRFVFAVEVNGPIDTGFAFCPWISFGNENFQINITLYDFDGNVHGTRTIQFTGHVAQFISQLFGNISPFVGYASVEAQEFVHLEVLRLEVTPTGFQLTSTQPDDFVNVEPSFAPHASPIRASAALAEIKNLRPLLDHKP